MIRHNDPGSKSSEDHEMEEIIYTYNSPDADTVITYDIEGDQHCDVREE